MSVDVGSGGSTPGCLPYVPVANWLLPGCAPAAYTGIVTGMPYPVHTDQPGFMLMHLQRQRQQQQLQQLQKLQQQRECQKRLRTAEGRDAVAQDLRPDAKRSAFNPVQNQTNFSICEILKPTFGRREDSRRSPGSRRLSTSSCSSAGSCEDDVPESASPCDNKDSVIQFSPGGERKETHSHQERIPNRDAAHAASTDDPDPSGDEDRLRRPESQKESASSSGSSDNSQWPAWVFCTRYSDRPSAGPRTRKPRKRERGQPEEKRPRTAFTSEQLSRLRVEFESSRYLAEDRRRRLADELGLSQSQVKIWFQNKRAKLKKSTGTRSTLAEQLMAQGLYNHTNQSMTSLQECPSSPSGHMTGS